jgi:hypothetical protein
MSSRAPLKVRCGCVSYGCSASDKRVAWSTRKKHRKRDQSLYAEVSLELPAAIPVTSLILSPLNANELEISPALDQSLAFGHQDDSLFDLNDQQIEEDQLQAAEQEAVNDCQMSYNAEPPIVQYPLFPSSSTGISDFLVDLLHKFRLHLVSRECQTAIFSVIQKAFSDNPQFPSSLHRAKTLVESLHRRKYSLNEQSIQRFAVCRRFCCMVRVTDSETSNCAICHEPLFDSEWPGGELQVKQRPKHEFLQVNLVDLLRPLFATSCIARIFHQSFEDRIHHSNSNHAYDQYGGLYHTTAWKRFTDPLTSSDPHFVVLSCVIDSFQAFKRGASSSITPILLNILNFPTYLRNHAPLMLTWGLLVGFSATQLVLTKLVEDLNSRSATLFCAHCNKQVLCQWQLMFITGDYKGLVDMCMMHGQNASYGCMKCELKGARPLGWKAIKYDHRSAPLRTSDSVALQAEEAKAQQEALCGVKGRSELYGIVPAIDLVGQTPLDLMHVLGHVVEKVVDLFAMRRRNKAYQAEEETPEIKKLEKQRRQWSHLFNNTHWAVVDKIFLRLRKSYPSLIPNHPSFQGHVGNFKTYDWLVFSQVYGKYLLKQLFNQLDDAHRSEISDIQLKMTCELLDIVNLCSSSFVTPALIQELKEKLEVFFPLFNENFPQAEKSIMYHLLSHFPAQMELWGSQRNLWLFPWERHNSFDSRAIKSSRYPGMNLYRTGLSRLVDVCLWSAQLFPQLKEAFLQRNSTIDQSEFLASLADSRLKDKHLGSILTAWQTYHSNPTSICTVFEINLTRSDKLFINGYQFSSISRDDDQNKKKSLFRTNVKEMGGALRFEPDLRLQLQHQHDLYGRVRGWYRVDVQLQQESDRTSFVCALVQLFSPYTTRCEVTNIQTICISSSQLMKDSYGNDAHLIPISCILSPIILAECWKQKSTTLTNESELRCVINVQR